MCDSAARNVEFRHAECKYTAISVGDSGQMEKSSTIRGLERGLQLLQSNPILSLHELHLTTRISKPTLLRILATLEQSGLVSRRLGDGRYRVSPNLTRMPRRRARYDRIAEAASPVLDRLSPHILAVPPALARTRS